MFGLYLFAVLLGLPLLLWFAFAGDADGGGDVGDGSYAVLSLSSLIFAIAFFGAGGLLSTVLGLYWVIALVIAVVSGLLAALLNHYVFAWLKNTESSSIIPDKDIESTVARVIVPISKQQRGRVVFNKAGSRIQMTATVLEDDVELDEGESVLILRVDSNVAVVMPVSSDLSLT